MVCVLHQPRSAIFERDSTISRARRGRPRGVLRPSARCARALRGAGTRVSRALQPGGVSHRPSPWTPTEARTPRRRIDRGSTNSSARGLEPRRRRRWRTSPRAAARQSRRSRRQSRRRTPRSRRARRSRRGVGRAEHRGRDRAAPAVPARSDSFVFWSVARGNRHGARRGSTAFASSPPRASRWRSAGVRRGWSGRQVRETPRRRAHAGGHLGVHARRLSFALRVSSKARHRGEEMARKRGGYRTGSVFLLQTARRDPRGHDLPGGVRRRDGSAWAFARRVVRGSSARSRFRRRRRRVWAYRWARRALRREMALAVGPCVDGPQHHVGRRDGRDARRCPSPSARLQRQSHQVGVPGPALLRV